MVFDKIIKRSHLVALAIFIPLLSSGQAIERERPAEWSKLVYGARFMDRFMPMPKGKTAQDLWGADSVRNRYVDNGIELPEISFWGGNILKSSDGAYHMYVCGWPENSPEGHMYWPKSTVFHAKSGSLAGPYSLIDTIGAGHNPEAFVLGDGRIVVYVIGGRYIASSIDANDWEFGKFSFDPRGRDIIEGLSNLTFARRPDGSYLMVCRGGGVWVSRDGVSEYQQLTNKRVYPDVDGCFEDPVVWRDSLQYHLIVNDWLGRIAFYQRSKDGINWVTEQGEAYVPGISYHEDGEIENWFKYERAKVFQDEHGRAIQMNFAVIDTIKLEDRPNDNHSSKNICVPLNRGMLLSVLNEKPITRKTKEISVRIKAEDDFKPGDEVDLNSLRFGAFSEVNFGRGSKPLSHKFDGEDLIVVFDGKSSGITPDEFAPKMIGRDKSGKLLFGYASLPYVDYRPAILSAKKEEVDSVLKTMAVEVQNFGLSASGNAKIELVHKNKTIGKKSLPDLLPYEKTRVVFSIDDALAGQKEYETVISVDGVVVERL